MKITYENLADFELSGSDTVSEDLQNRYVNVVHYGVMPDLPQSGELVLRSGTDVVLQKSVKSIQQNRTYLPTMYTSIIFYY